jgi:hypothetical protein
MVMPSVKWGRIETKRPVALILNFGGEFMEVG